MAWTVIYIASNRTEAENLKGILSREGILVSLRQVGAQGRGHVEVMVPEGEAEEAHEILAEALRR